MKPSKRPAFTLVELVVVIIIMTMLAGLSAIAYRSIAIDMKMSAAMNTISSALDNARALAIKKNRYVMTAFSPRLEDEGSAQLIDIVVAEWSGDSSNANNGSGSIWTYDRFVPVSNLEVRTISGGINVAGPGYGTGDDNQWWVCTYLPAQVSTGPVFGGLEPYGSLIGVLYSPEGRVVTRNAESGADRIWVDFNQDGVQTINADDTVEWPWPGQLPSIGSYFDLEIQGGEPFVSMTPILAVFDEVAFREGTRTADWGNSYDRDVAYTSYIEKNASRIQFNRYSGVPLE